MYSNTDDRNTNRFPFENPPDYEPILPQGITLSATQVTDAFAIAQRSSHPNKRWSIYLNALALAGFEQWLTVRNAIDIQFDRTHSSILEPIQDHSATAVHNIEANGFRICLIAIPSCPDNIVSFPKSLLDQTEQFAHFYIPIAIQEELSQINIQGWLTGQELHQQQTVTTLATNRDGTYAIPSTWFIPDLDRLLLTLSCTQPQPINNSIRNATGNTIQNNPLREILTEPITNVKRWIERRVDNLIQDLEWCLLPTWQVAGALRGETGLMSTEGEIAAMEDADAFLTILKTLARQGLTVSSDTRAAYRTLYLGTLPLQLCILTKPLDVPGNLPEWSLTVILKPKIGTYLPDGIGLQITEQDTRLVEHQTQPESPVGSLFTRVVGERHEQFIIRVSQRDGTSLTLSPIAFGEGA